MAAQALLIGIALLKNGAKADHPKVLQEGPESKKAIASHDAAKIDAEMGGDNMAYSTGLSITFLVELDPQAHHGEIEFLLKRFPVAAEEARRRGNRAGDSATPLSPSMRCSAYGRPSADSTFPWSRSSRDHVACEDARPQRVASAIKEPLRIAPTSWCRRAR